MAKCNRISHTTSGGVLRVIGSKVNALPQRVSKTCISNGLLRLEQCYCLLKLNRAESCIESWFYGLATVLHHNASHRVQGLNDSPAH